MTAVFSRFLSIDVPQELRCDASRRNPPFSIVFVANGPIPFAQVILRADGKEHLVRDEAIRRRHRSAEGHITYVATVPPGLLRPGTSSIQIEGCRRADIDRAAGADWIKEFRELKLVAEAAAGTVAPAPTRARVKLTPGVYPPEPRIYFGIHKHMHQPYYKATDPSYWDGEKEEIFGSRVGPYTGLVPAAVRQYVAGALPHAGLSTSWSGTLIEQLARCASQGLGGGRFGGWNEALRSLADAKTALGNPRLDFTAFGFFHPLMPLIPARNIVRQIEWHRRLLPEYFDVEPSNILFPPETAFHVRMIPALQSAGIEAVIYDSIHRFRTCRNYPYAGVEEGMLPPNPADQRNPPATDWLQLHNIWAGSKIAPSLLRPEYVRYVDPEGSEFKLIAVPAERYIGNEDARGGFGALQYPDVLGQVYEQVVATGTFDPRHPPFFLLHSDGDNHGGGAESYYQHNTGRMVEWLQRDPRFELISIRDYLQTFPPDPAQGVHIEPGSWSGADNGDPQFMKWFSRYHESYSPDLNSWAVLTALHNTVHSLEDAGYAGAVLEDIQRLMFTAETSCYWYWTGQTEWDSQVTLAANLALAQARGQVDALLSAGTERTPPTIFPPWVTPENPGGKRWGQGCLISAPREAVVHTFVYDISDVKRVTLTLRTVNGELHIDMKGHGPYPCRSGATATSRYYTADLPVGVGDIFFFVESEDAKGNVARSSLESIHLA